MKMKTALTIAGSDCSGGAGIQADLKTMTMNGVFAMGAITALTAQNTTGVRAIEESTPEFLKDQIDAVFEDIFPDAVKPGSPAAFFRWLPLPHLNIDEMELERQLLQQGVSVYGSYRFAVQRNQENFIRLAISSPENEELLKKGLNIVKDFLTVQ